jgi:hypothetical protein
LGSPVVEASRAWTRWVMVATMHAAGGTVEEAVSQTRVLFLPTRSRLSGIATPTRSVSMIVGVIHVSSVFPDINLHFLIHCDGAFIIYI